MATKKLSFDELKARIDGAPWDDVGLCDFILDSADPADPDNMEIMSRADDLLNAIRRLDELCDELEIERG